MVHSIKYYLHFMRIAVFIFLLFTTLSSSAQKKTAFISGKVIDENEDPLGGVTVTILGKQNGILTSDSGYYRIKVPAEKAFALVFTHADFHDEQKNFYLSDGEEEQLTVKLIRSSKILQTVVIQNNKERNETGLVKINPKNAITLPGATGGVEGLI